MLGARVGRGAGGGNLGGQWKATYVYAVCTFEEIISRAGTLSGTQAQDVLHMLQTRHRPSCKDVRTYVRMYFVLNAPFSICTSNYQL